MLWARTASCGRRSCLPSLTASIRTFPAAVATMPDDDEWTPGEVASLIVNPFYADSIDEGLAVPHEPLIGKDDWIMANVRLIEEFGPEPYLRNLLSVLKGNYPRGS
jgi:hypothetical protein